MLVRALLINPKAKDPEEEQCLLIEPGTSEDVSDLIKEPIVLISNLKMHH